MNIRFLTILPILLPLAFSALEPARVTAIGTDKRQAIFLRAESGEGLVAFMPEGKAGWRLNVYPLPGFLAAFAVADFDRDGNADLALIKTTGEFATLLGNGQGGFDIKSNSRGVLHGFTPIALQVEDLNGDGNPDLALFDGKRRLDLKNDGFGNLEAAAAAKDAPPVASAAFTADFFASGTPERIEIRSDRVLIYPSPGGSPVEVTSPYLIRAAAVGDFSGHGATELALISFGERPRLQIISAAPGAHAATGASSFNAALPDFPSATCNVSIVVGPAFSPATCSVNVNDTVNWSGLAAGIHTVTSINTTVCTDTCNGKFCSPASVSVFSHTFLSTAEASNYKCSVHCAFSAMKGVVNVAAPATPGTIPDTVTPFKVKKSTTAGSLDLTWGTSCSATATASVVYEGTIGAAFAYNHTSMPSAGCSTAGTAATVIPSAGNTYYLIVARTASNEGSYGKNSGNVEIPPAAIGACLPQNLTGSC